MPSPGAKADFDGPLLELPAAVAAEEPEAPAGGGGPLAGRVIVCQARGE